MPIVPRNTSHLGGVSFGGQCQLTRQKDAKNNIKGSLKLEYLPWLPKAYIEGKLVDDGYTITPLILGSLDYTRDWEADGNVIKASFFIAPLSYKPYFPHAKLRDKSGAFRGRYYVYLGYEYFKNNSEVLDYNIGFASARLYLELWPISTPARNYLQLIFDYIYRKKAHGSGGNISDSQDLSVGLNFYLFGNKSGSPNIAVGIDYLHGEDSQNSFIFRKQWSIGIRIKLN
jgi:hypothetical protein